MSTPATRVFEVGVKGARRTCLLRHSSSGKAKSQYLRQVQEAWSGVKFTDITCRALPMDAETPAETIARNHELAVERFNAANQVGAKVRFWTWTREGEGKTGTTWSAAMRAASGHPVVYIRDDQGKNIGSVSLTHVEPIGGAQ